MRDYRLNRKQQPDYIIEAIPKTSVFEEAGETETYDTLDIKFADGKVFKNVMYDEENLKKIEDRQEQQVTEGITNLPIFEKRLTRSGIMTAASIVGGPVIASGISHVAAQSLQTPVDPTMVVCAGGVLALCGAIPAAISLVKNLPIVKELKKLKYRNEHRDELDHFEDYENALAGFSNGVAGNYMAAKLNDEDPFSISNVDGFTQKEMETIVSNIEREKELGFTYVKKPRPSTGK